MNTTDVLQRIDDGWRRLTERVEGIEPTTFVQPVKDDWSPKDHVAHVAAWEEFLLAILEKRDRHRSMGVGDLRGQETDAINDAVFHSRRTLAPDEVWTSLAETHRTERSAIESLSDSDLRRPRSDFQPDREDGGESGEESLLDEIEWNTWGHYEQHIAWLTALILKWPAPSGCFQCFEGMRLASGHPLPPVPWAPQHPSTTSLAWSPCTSR